MGPAFRSDAAVDCQRSDENDSISAGFVVEKNRPMAGTRYTHYIRSELLAASAAPARACAWTSRRGAWVDGLVTPLPAPIQAFRPPLPACSLTSLFSRSVRFTSYFTGF